MQGKPRWQMAQSITKSHTVTCFMKWFLYFAAFIILCFSQPWHQTLQIAGSLQAESEAQSCIGCRYGGRTRCEGQVQINPWPAAPDNGISKTPADGRTYTAVWGEDSTNHVSENHKVESWKIGRIKSMDFYWSYKKKQAQSSKD